VNLLAITLLLAATPKWESPRVPADAPAPAGLGGMKASDCGACHQEIYAEWQTSTHAHAWVDAQFQREIAKDPEVAWVCINCHTPAGDQQVEITVSTGEIRAPERTPNPNFDPVWQQEGISCATCHIRDGAVLGPYGDTNAPHPVTHDPEMRSSALCLGCHQAVARVEATLVCSFNTGMEAQEAGETRSCQSCHMPEVTRPLLPGGEARPSRKHLWQGSGIPKTAEQAKMDLWNPAPPPGMAAEMTPPEDAAPGETVEVGITLKTLDIGHMVPSGDPERYYIAEAVVRAPDGAQVGRVIYRVGQIWKWWPEAERLEDNRLVPGETRQIALSFVQPPGGATVTLELTHYRISPENAGYHGLEGYPTHRVVSREEAEVRAVDSDPAGG